MGDRLKLQSAGMAEENIRKLGELFPNCVTEEAGADGEVRRAVNFELLRQMLSEEERKTDEVYEFTWVGKRAAMAEANRPVRKTLRPCPEKSSQWDETENLYIEGDNLDVLKLLQESYLGKVKMIYIDPPYNTGSDFIYQDNFKMSSQEYEEQMGMYDEDNRRLFRNTDSNGRFHSDWCSMMYSRLMLARNLLAEDGVIFISIDDCEVQNLHKICNEIFGESNFAVNMVWQSTAGSNTGTDIVTVTENILVYTKNRKVFQFDGMPAEDTSYRYVDEYVGARGKYALDKLDRRRVGSHYSEALNYPLTMPDGTLRYPGGGTERSAEGWNYLWSRSKVEWGLKNGFIEFKNNGKGWNVYNKRYAKIDNEGNPVERTVPFRNLITSDQCSTAQGTAELRSLFQMRPFDFPKPSALIRRLLNTAVRRDPEALILDFFSGSASTAHAVMQMNAEDGGKRKFIMVQLPEACAKDSEAYAAGYETICGIGQERIRRAARKIGEDFPKVDFDGGFRVFCLDESNMKEVYYSAEETSQELLDSLVSNVKEDRTDLDLLYGCLLDWGLPLSVTHRAEIIGGCTVHICGDGELAACFDACIPAEVIRQIAARKPRKAVFRDSSFRDTPAKMNMEEAFQTLAPDSQVKVI